MQNVIKGSSREIKIVSQVNSTNCVRNDRKKHHRSRSSTTIIKKCNKNHTKAIAELYVQTTQQSKISTGSLHSFRISNHQPQQNVFDYMTVWFSQLKRGYQVIKSSMFKFNIGSIVTDYEQGAINAFSKVFLEATQYGYFFHFLQCIWKKLGGIKTAISLYKSNADFKVGIQMLPALAFVPLNKVSAAFEKLMDASFYFVHQILQPLLDYMEDT